MGNYFWNNEYRHLMRDIYPEVAQKIIAERMLAKNLALDGVSDEHLDIIQEVYSYGIYNPISSFNIDEDLNFNKCPDLSIRKRLIDGALEQGFENFDDSLSHLITDKVIKMREDLVHEKEDEFKYQMLGRLYFDIKAFTDEGGFGYGKEQRLWAGNVEGQIKEMEKLWNEIRVKPIWLSMEAIKNYKMEMYMFKLEIEKDNPDFITKDNIAQYYEFMSDEDKYNNLSIVMDVFNNRQRDIEAALNVRLVAPISENLHFKGSPIGRSSFGMKDTLKPIDEYIEDIKASEEYQAYKSNLFSSLDVDEAITKIEVSLEKLNDIEDELIKFTNQSEHKLASKFSHARSRLELFKDSLESLKQPLYELAKTELESDEVKKLSKDEVTQKVAEMAGGEFRLD
ncbi:MAG: hypothetical protein QG567_2405, partial [Campylobacterota bacterium]|nr:hypothetical protein [Campylobacterota bacterium]